MTFKRPQQDQSHDGPLFDTAMHKQIDLIDAIKKGPKPMKYRTNCVNANGEDITNMVDAGKSITREEFVRQVDQDDLAELETSLGYAPNRSEGMVMADDYHVTYHGSQYQDADCCYFCWSAIEHVFTNA